MRARKAFPLTLICLVLMGMATILSGRLPSAESNLERYVLLSGRIAGRQLSIPSRCGGTVEQLMVRKGDRVAAGTPLLRIGEEEVSERLAEVDALIQEMENEKLSQLEHLATLRPFGPVSLEMAEAGALFAAVELSMAETSSGDPPGTIGATSKVQRVYPIDEIRKRYDLAMERLAQVREAGDRIERATGELSLVTAQLEELERERQGLLFRLRQGEVTTPFDVYVAEVLVTSGQTVSRGQELLELNAQGTFFLEGFLTEEQAEMVEEGNETLVYVPPQEMGPIRGKVGRVGSRAEAMLVPSQGGKFEPRMGLKVQLVLADASGRLHPGQPAEAIIRGRCDRSPPVFAVARMMSVHSHHTGHTPR